MTASAFEAARLAHPPTHPPPRPRLGSKWGRCIGRRSCDAASPRPYARGFACGCTVAGGNVCGGTRGCSTHLSSPVVIPLISCGCSCGYTCFSSFCCTCDFPCTCTSVKSGGFGFLQSCVRLQLCCFTPPSYCAVHVICVWHTCGCTCGYACNHSCSCKKTDVGYIELTCTASPGLAHAPIGMELHMWYTCGFSRGLTRRFSCTLFSSGFPCGYGYA